MPIPPKPFALVCPQCGHRETHFPTSDVLSMSLHCPRCKDQQMDMRPASAWDQLRSVLTGRTR